MSEHESLVGIRVSWSDFVPSIPGHAMGCDEVVRSGVVRAVQKSWWHGPRLIVHSGNKLFLVGISEVTVEEKAI